MMDFILQHWAEFSAAGGALLVIGGIIVKLTPTKTDDKWWRGVMRALGRE
jgi:hypothetical protein